MLLRTKTLVFIIFFILGGMLRWSPSLPTDFCLAPSYKTELAFSRQALLALWDKKYQAYKAGQYPQKAPFAYDIEDIQEGNIGKFKIIVNPHAFIRKGNLDDVIDNRPPTFDPGNFNFTKLAKKINPTQLLVEKRIHRRKYLFLTAQEPSSKDHILVVPARAKAQAVTKNMVWDIVSLQKESGGTFLQNGWGIAGVNSQHVHFFPDRFPIGDFKIESGMKLNNVNIGSLKDYPAETIVLDGGNQEERALLAEKLYKILLHEKIIYHLAIIDGKVIFILRSNDGPQIQQVERKYFGGAGIAAETFAGKAVVPTRSDLDETKFVLALNRLTITKEKKKELINRLIKRYSTDGSKSATLETYDPRFYEMVVLTNALSGDFYFDRQAFQFYVNGEKNSDFKPKANALKLIQNYLDSPEGKNKEIVACLNNGDVYMNPWSLVIKQEQGVNILYTNGRELTKTYGKNLYSSNKAYPLLIARTNGTVSIEYVLLKDFGKRKNTQGKIEYFGGQLYYADPQKRNREIENIRFATFLKPNVFNGEPIDPADISSMCKDARWLFSFPTYERRPLGANQLLSDAQKMKQAAQGKAIVLDLDKINQLIPDSTIQKIKNIFNQSGYTEMAEENSVLKRGQYFINPDKKEIKIGLLEGKMPVSTLGIDKEGNLVVGKFEGYSMKECGGFLSRYVTASGQIAEGGDSNLINVGATDKSYTPQATSLILIVKDKHSGIAKVPVQISSSV